MHRWHQIRILTLVDPEIVTWQSVDRTDSRSGYGHQIGGARAAIGLTIGEGREKRARTRLREAVIDLAAALSMHAFQVPLTEGLRVHTCPSKISYQVVPMQANLKVMNEAVVQGK